MFKPLSPVVDLAHAFLDIGQTPTKADCIFVFAGRPERKHYGLQLFRQGFAKTLILSVGRFEWRRFPELKLANDGGLHDMVQQIPARRRHFFVEIASKGTSCTPIEKRALGTMGEAIALSQRIEEQEIRSLLIVSSGFHLRRAVESVRHFSAASVPVLIPVAVPLASIESTRSATAVSQECFKYLLYQGLLRGRRLWRPR